MEKFSRTTAISVVVANMVGTGVFTSLGFQLLGIQSAFVLMMLWFVGGLTALCGALTYAELGAQPAPALAASTIFSHGSTILAPDLSPAGYQPLLALPRRLHWLP